MIIVIDSNEYINYLNNKIRLLEDIFMHDVSIYINELIIKEVLDNINEKLKKEFYRILYENNIVTDYKKLPLHLHEKYKNSGLKKGDIVIAAFCEYVKANYLITENRHFLKLAKFDKFKVINSKDFIKYLFS